jgi:hypothetical protein
VRRHGLQRVESRSALNVDGAPVCGGGKKNWRSPSLLSETAEFATWE